MKRSPFFLAGALSGILAHPVCAQQPYVVASGTATASIYAQQQIELVAPFEATTNGFEANTRLPEATAGRWSKPLLWTPYQRYLNSTPPPGISKTVETGMIGIHTHVLPNGKVLSWEGHNDDYHINTGTGAVLSHAYEWNPDPNATHGTLVYPHVYDHFDTSYSNIFCSGHAFLANGNLLVAGGHYSGGAVLSLTLAI